MQENSSPDRTPPPGFAITARDWAWKQDVAPPARKLVLLAVCERLNHGTGIAWPGADDVAGRCGLNRRQTQVHLAALIDAGLLLVVERKHGKGRPYPVYTVPPLVQYAAQSPQGNGTLSAAERTKLVQPTAQTFVQPTAPEPVRKEPVTKNQGAAPPKPPAPVKPAPKPPSEKQLAIGHPRVQAFFDGLRAGGEKHPFEGVLTGQDFKMIKEGDFDAGDLGACCRATADGTWPGADAWIKERLSVVNIHKYRYGRWITRTTPTAAPSPTATPDRFKGPNGQPDTTASLYGWMQRRKAREEADRGRDDTGAVLPALPAPGNRL